LIGLIAAAFGVPKRAVTIVAGERSKLKRVAIAGVDDAQAVAVLQSFGIDPGTIKAS